MNAALMTRREVADQLRVSLRLVDGLIGGGQIQVVRIGRRVLVAQEALADFVARAAGASQAENPAESPRGRPRSR